VISDWVHRQCSSAATEIRRTHFKTRKTLSFERERHDFR
jgi:hypothetical protein